MEWNNLGWKCKIQKKFIDFLVLLCCALIVIIIILTSHLREVEYSTMADLAAEAAVHAHWEDVYTYDVYRMNLQISQLEEECALMQSQLDAAD